MMWSPIKTKIESIPWPSAALLFTTSLLAILQSQTAACMPAASTQEAPKHQLILQYRLPFNPTAGRASNFDLVTIDAGNPKRAIKGLKFVNGRWYFKRGFKPDTLAAARGFGKRSSAGFKTNTLVGARGFGKRRTSGFKTDTLAGARGFGKRVNKVLGFKAETLSGARGFGKRTMMLKEEPEDLQLSQKSPTAEAPGTDVDANHPQDLDESNEQGYEDLLGVLPPSAEASVSSWPAAAAMLQGKNGSNKFQPQFSSSRAPFAVLLEAIPFGQPAFEPADEGVWVDKVDDEDFDRTYSGAPPASDEPVENTPMNTKTHIEGDLEVADNDQSRS